MIRASSRTGVRAASLLVIVALLIGVLLLLQISHLSENTSRYPSVDLPQRRSGRPLQALYQVEAQASADGWTPERARLAGDLWREAGDLTRAVAYWEAAPADATLLRDRAQAYLDLARWADASNALDRLLALLPDNSPDRAWAQFQLGAIRMATDPARAADLLQAAQPSYPAEVTVLLAALTSPTDPMRAGIALADLKLWAYAELAFSQASGDPLALAYGGWVRDMQGKSGARWIDAAVALGADSAQVRLLQGLHLRLNYDYAGSLAAIIQATALDPENPALYAELGTAYQLTGDLTAAEHWLKYAVSLDDRMQPQLDAFYAGEMTLLDNLGLVNEADLSTDPARTIEP